MGSKSKSGTPRRVRVPRKLIEPVFGTSPPGNECVDIGSDSADSLSEMIFSSRPSIVQFRLDRNTFHPPGPVNTPKGGFVNKCPPPPSSGILKWL